MSQPDTTARAAKGPGALDFKSATLYAVRVVLHDHDTDALLAALDQRMRDAGALFEDEPVVIDANGLDTVIDWPVLLGAMRGHRLYPVGVVAEGEQRHAALAAGLAPVELGQAPTRPPSTPQTVDAPAISVQAAPVPAAAAEAAPPAIAPAAVVVQRPLRSGQRVYARNTDLIVIGVVSQGAEVIADGNIHIYGPMRGKAMAGARGDASARIFTTQLDPELLSIAGVYRVLEAPLDPSQRNRPCIVRLDEERLVITALGD